jgi:sporulation protein YlmC with PRC-barrel domain
MHHITVRNIMTGHRTAAIVALSFAWVLGCNAVQAQDAGTSTITSSAVDAEKLIGRTIENPTGENVGEIESVVLDQSGKVQYAIVGVGGFLGIGEKKVAMEWADLTISENGEKVVTVATKDQLAALPDYKYPETAKPGTVYSYDEAVKTNPTLEEQTTPAAGIEGIAASKLVGATVTNANGDSIGEIHEVLLSAEGEADALIVDVGGFLGMGEHTVAMKWTDISIRSDDNNTLVVATEMTKEQLQDLPEYELQSVQ